MKWKSKSSIVICLVLSGCGIFTQKNPIESTEQLTNEQSSFKAARCKPIKSLPKSDHNFVRELEVLLQNYVDCQARHNSDAGQD